MSPLDFTYYRDRYTYRIKPSMTAGLYRDIPVGIDCSCSGCATFGGALDRVVPERVRRVLGAHGIDWAKPCYLITPSADDQWLYGEISYEFVGARTLLPAGSGVARSYLRDEGDMVWYDEVSAIPPGAIRPQFQSLGHLLCVFWLDTSDMHAVAAPVDETDVE